MKQTVLIIIAVIFMGFFTSRSYAVHIDSELTGISFTLPDDWQVSHLSNGLTAMNKDKTMIMELKYSPVQYNWKGVEEYLKAVLLTNHGESVELQKTYGLNLNDLYLIAREFNFKDAKGKEKRGAIAVIQTLQGYSYIYAYSTVNIDAGFMADLLNFSQTVQLYKKVLDYKEAHLQVAVPFNWQHTWITNGENQVLKVEITNSSFRMYVGYVPQVMTRNKALEWVNALGLDNNGSNMVWTEPLDIQLDTTPALIQTAHVPKPPMTPEEKRLAFRISLTNPDAVLNYEDEWNGERMVLYTGHGLAYSYIIYNRMDCRREWPTIRKLKDYYKVIE